MYQLLENLKHKIEWDRELGLKGYSTSASKLDIADFSYIPTSDNLQNSKQSNQKLPINPVAHIKRPTGSPVTNNSADLKQRVISCRACHLSRQYVPFFEYETLNAQIAFIGDMPSAQEINVGIPFAGERGNLLNKMISAMGFSRNNVYLCNIIKCPADIKIRRMSYNELAESFKCTSFIKEQLMHVKPKVIVALGQTAAQFLLEKNIPVNTLKGEFFNWNNIKVMATYHLDYMLQKPESKKTVWQDLKKVMSFLQNNV